MCMFQGRHGDGKGSHVCEAKLEILALQDTLRGTYLEIIPGKNMQKCMQVSREPCKMRQISWEVRESERERERDRRRVLYNFNQFHRYIFSHTRTHTYIYIYIYTHTCAMQGAKKQVRACMQLLCLSCYGIRNDYRSWGP